jgi:hypothetical protein
MVSLLACGLSTATNSTPESVRVEREAISERTRAVLAAAKARSDPTGAVK